MKFVLILVALLAVAYAEQAASKEPTLSMEKLQEALIDAGVAPEQAQGFLDVLKGIGQFALKIAPTVLPMFLG